MDLSLGTRCEVWLISFPVQRGTRFRQKAATPDVVTQADVLPLFGAFCDVSKKRWPKRPRHLLTRYGDLCFLWSALLVQLFKITSHRLADLVPVLLPCGVLFKTSLPRGGPAHTSPPAKMLSLTTARFETFTRSRSERQLRLHTCFRHWSLSKKKNEDGNLSMGCHCAASNSESQVKTPSSSVPKTVRIGAWHNTTW